MLNSLNTNASIDLSFQSSTCMLCSILGLRNLNLSYVKGRIIIIAKTGHSMTN